MRSRRTFLAAFFLFPIFALGQSTIVPTTKLTITGAVKQELIISVDDLSRYPEVSIGDVVITNHLGERKGVAKSMKGVSLKKLLSAIEFTAENPKQLSEFYLTFVASDGYKVVYSWNEIFNSVTGDSTFVVTEKDGKELLELPEGMLVLTKSDEKTGRRYIKGLEKIIVSRVQ